MRVLQALQEIVETEIQYLKDLQTITELKRVMLLTCDPAVVTNICGNCDALLGINSELLDALKGDGARPEDFDLERCANAFETLAPYLRAYSGFCTQAISAQEKMKTLRRYGGD